MNKNYHNKIYRDKGNNYNKYNHIHPRGNSIINANKPNDHLPDLFGQANSENNKSSNNDSSIILALTNENTKLREELSQRDKLIRDYQKKIHYLEKDMNTYKNQLKIYREKSQKANSSNNVNKTNPSNYGDVFNQFPMDLLQAINQGQQEIPDDFYIDPVKEVEDQIISELCPNPDQMTYEQLLALEENVGSVSKGLSKTEVNKIPLVSFSRNIYKDEDKCAVCQYEFKNAEKVRRLRCTHMFHRECVDEWLLKDKTCPCCKADARPKY